MSLNVPIIIGTTRPGNKSQHAAAFVKKIADSYGGIDAHVISPDMFNMPGDGNDTDLKDPNYTKITEDADAFVLVVPEYNHSFPGTLKRLLDSESTNYIHKPVALVGVSSGSFGGVRAVEHIVPVVRELGMIVSFSSVFFTNSYGRFDENGGMLKDVERYSANVTTMLDELTWLAKSLEWGRENVESKYHGAAS